jgi:hypothetical protein
MVRSAKSTRFPFIAAAVCLVCLGVTGWTWMRYSYCWDMALAQLNRTHPDDLEGWFVRTEGDLSLAEDEWSYLGQATKGFFFHPRGMPLPDVGSHIVVTGRAVGLRRLPGPLSSVAPSIDCAASRFTWQSITGLIVGAIGVGVFGLTLRKWLMVRHQAAPSSIEGTQQD